MAGPRDLDDLQREIQELFSDLWQVPRFSGLHHGYRPQADCYRTDDPPVIHVDVELPGIDPDRIEIVVSGRTLAIAGNRERPQLPGARVELMEIEYGPFQRQIPLSDDVDTARTAATYERGLLRLELPIAPAPPPKASVIIEIRRLG